MDITKGPWGISAIKFFRWSQYQISAHRQIVDQVRNQPFAIQCAWRNSWSYANSIITYERLYYDNTSGGPILNGTMYGGLDINTGAFTVAPGFSGVWTVTYTIVGDDNNCSPTNEAYLYINGQRMGESRYHSGGTGAWQDSTSSRTVYMTLKIGDTVTFRTASMCKNLLSISLCFELTIVTIVIPTNQSPEDAS